MEKFRFVIDTNVLIDFAVGGILRELFRLEAEWMIPDLALQEIHQPEPSLLRQLGLSVLELTGAEVAQVSALRESYLALSVADLALLVLALREGAILITGDKGLRTAALSQRVVVHGTLWLMDELVMRGVLDKRSASGALRTMQANQRRLPQRECQRRLKQWDAEP